MMRATPQEATSATVAETAKVRMIGLVRSFAKIRAGELSSHLGQYLYRAKFGPPHSLLENDKCIRRTRQPYVPRGLARLTAWIPSKEVMSLTRTHHD